jgi:hypothetical protein
MKLKQLSIMLWLFVCGAGLTQSVSAQTFAGVKDTSYWSYTGVATINFNQVQFGEWAAGGVNSYSLGALANLGLNYKKDRWEWNNILDMAIGVLGEENQKARKNEDRIDFLSRLGWKQTEKWLWQARLNYRSQFIKGYAPPNFDENAYISRFNAPAFITVSLGAEWRPTSWLSIHMAPVAGKITIVNDQRLADSAAFGVKPGERTRYEFGALVSALAKKEWKYVRWQSRLDLFNNYTDENTPNRQNIDVTLENLLVFPVTKWLGITLFNQFIYDDDIRIPKRDANKLPIAGTERPILQFKQTLGVGLTYAIGAAAAEKK